MAPDTFRSPKCEGLRAEEHHLLGLESEGEGGTKEPLGQDAAQWMVTEKWRLDPQPWCRKRPPQPSHRLSCPPLPGVPFLQGTHGWHLHILQV